MKLSSQIARVGGHVDHGTFAKTSLRADFDLPGITWQVRRC